MILILQSKFSQSRNGGMLKNCHVATEVSAVSKHHPLRENGGATAATGDGAPAAGARRVAAAGGCSAPTSGLEFRTLW